MNEKAPNMDFLPAVLEVQHTPPSKAGRVICYVILALIISAILWATYSRIDVVAVARGQLTVSGLARPIHPLISGEISSINVEEGQHVREGERLLTLDDEQIQSELKESQIKLSIIEAQLSRYRTMLEIYQTNTDISASLIPIQQNVKDERIVGQIRIDSNSYQSALRKYQSMKDQENSNIKVKNSELNALSSTLPLLEQQLASLKALEEKNMLPVYNYLELKKEVVSAQYEVQSLQERVNASNVNIEAIESEKEMFRSEIIQQTSEKIIDLEDQYSIATKEVEQLSIELAKYSIYSPVSGYVKDLLYRDKSAMAVEGQALMVIVPDNESMLAEVMVLNKDIGFIEEGHSVAIKLDAFDFSRYGKLSGNVKNISADANQDEKLGLVYRAMVSINEQSIEADGKARELEPGMSLTAEVKLGRRTVMSYLLSTIKQEVDNAGKQK
ncbi:HlyD family type I secretion periplasmic adaptor subunit [Vibrio sp. Evd11]|uniref:HlyD family type I secretion periplasmic adaptor subunit n=1 Tax=Vibrio sp. Evd11 TaxID=1207404 RepID=UPI000EFD862C|nr:HlyD family type I secretion periplasmic adaptor subunit [Vibrio sp. Evd11]